MKGRFKFRAKSLEGGDWTYGSLVYFRNSDSAHIIPYGTSVLTGEVVCYFEEVDKRTIGQFTGFCDKKGVEVFEGDIVEIELFGRGVVEWDGDRFAVNGSGNWLSQSAGVAFGMTVIGNVHDNPELLNEE